MFDFRTGPILGLLWRTLPFLALRLVVYLGIALAYVVAVGIGGGIGLLFGHIGGQGGGGAGLGGLIGFVVVTGLLFWAREYLLYLVKAAHVAVLVELIDGRGIPAGRGQIEHGIDAVKRHFGTSSLLFGLNQLLRGALGVFNRATVRLAAWLPVPGLESLVRLADAIVSTSLSHLDQVVLAQILRAPAANPWATASDAAVLYAQNYKAVLKNAALLTFVVWALTLLVLIAVAAPVAALIGLFHVHAGIWTFALAVVAALSLKAALIDPFATVALLQVYDGVTRGQAPDPEWRARLESLSSQFRELTRRAGGVPVAPMPMPPPPPRPAI
ncbi:MAG TPA: hypothetical protein VGC30_05935 [Dokdonella sp.]